MPKFESFRMPDAGEGLTEAEIVAWHVAVGDPVRVNQTIVEIETAKSIVDLPSPFAGVVTALLAEVGDTVDVGTPIITIDVDPTGPTPEIAARPALELDAAPAATPDATPEAAGAGAGDGEAVLVGYGISGAAVARRPRRASAVVVHVDGTAASPSRVLAKPPVRKLARDLGVDLGAVVPTGPGGIVTREDVVAKSDQGEARALTTYPGDDQPWLASGKVSAGGRQTRVPVKSVRKRTAEAMVTSAFTAPHVTVFHTIDVTKTMKLVARLRADKEFAGVRVTPLLITAKAMLLAVHRHPDINASWDDATQEIVYKHYVNLGIAASTPRGLVVPNIKDAHRMGLKELAQSIADLTATARSGRTSPTDMSDGTITITNVGVFGIDTGTPILNPGEAAILAFGAIREQPWVHHGKVKKRWVTQLALSFDHRLVDGALGALFLSDVAAVLADPSQALVWG
ncbi:dihydrolipoamide acetyltransferase family protein [Pengzhenrongella frigida]|uniref:Dihydrolipoamide acetyltransferase component of pyruvate dehydrogenase complex n=1 Tax=Pengzhenrongella frigida TaxID=1259133 RepID=A0A4Q5MZJ1_9MICO|nr:dihydrolipoamide acetyltransferase family protein [Cellulomonas sp. HLT2-17]RYV51136.1 2-oxo acid dehydrogenase subunit E2 [Cellulomonas sp. HLT2-17]